jgi:nicotinamidase-related amidase
MIGLLVIDMQVGLFEGDPPLHDAERVIGRTAAIVEAVRAAGGIVIYIQHEDDYRLARGSAGWEMLPALRPTETDFVLTKEACDAFYETELSDLLARHQVQQLIITGCATEFCVDTTIRAAASRDYDVVVVEDGHTTKDRPHLEAESIIRHHNWTWENLILPRREVRVLPATRVVEWLQSGGPS